MEPWIIAILLFALFLLLMAIGVPVAVGLGLSSLILGALLMGPKAIVQIFASYSYIHAMEFILLAMPFFILMSEITMISGMGAALFEAGDAWFGKIPGGLAVATVLGCTGFSAISGMSVSTASAIGVVSIPEMAKRGYDNAYNVGAVAAGGTLGILIPPSVNLIIYGAVSDASVGKLFIAGIVPGLILAAIFCLYCVVMAIRRPALAPRTKGASWKERVLALRKTWAVLLLAVLVLGSIYAGVVTTTEAAAVGAVGALIICAMYRRLSLGRLKEAVLRTVRTNCFIFLILISSYVFSFVLGYLGVTQQISTAVVGLDLPRWGILAVIYILLGVLGCFILPAAMILITVPIFAPIIKGLGLDMVWFGILMTVSCEMANITPPVGANCFVIHGIAKPFGVTLGDVFKGSAPYVLLMFLMMALLTAFPQIVLWLPNQMK